MRVRAPASSANIGPGFDVLGLAVARYSWADDEGIGEPCADDHLARIAYEAAGGRGPIWFANEIEPARGLGFSAAARAAGALLALLQQGATPSQAQLGAYRVVAEIEGHGDNAAPAAFGGFHVIAGDVQHRVDGRLPGRLLFWVPDTATETDKSRAALAPTVSRADAVFNVGRVALLMAALYESRLDLLGPATADRLHQPPRFLAAESSAKAYESALQAGAAAAWLSGSGPTVAVVVDDDHLDEVRRVLGESAAVMELAVDDQGAIAV